MGSSGGGGHGSGETRWACTRWVGGGGGSRWGGGGEQEVQGETVGSEEDTMGLH